MSPEQRAQGKVTDLTLSEVRVRAQKLVVESAMVLQYCSQLKAFERVDRLGTALEEALSALEIIERNSSRLRDLLDGLR